MRVPAAPWNFPDDLHGPIVSTIYWVTGPLRSPYDFQLSQANNIIHGQLHLTEEHTRHLHLLERVLFDGEGFCLPTDDPRGPQAAADIENPRITDDCRHYMQHALGPAFMLVPYIIMEYPAVALVPTAMCELAVRVSSGPSVPMSV